MIRNKKRVMTIIIVLAILIVFTSIAFAALSTTLNITMNKVTQSAQTWNIGFQTGTVNGVLTATDTNQASCGSATATANAITGVKVKLAYVGDRCAYTFKIQNNGSIAGQISNIEVTKPNSTTCTITGSTMVCGNITYKLHYDTATSTSLVAVNDTINAKSGSTATIKTVVLTAEYTGTTQSTSDFTQSGFAYKLTYAQK